MTLDIIEVVGVDPEDFTVVSTLGNEYANIIPEPSVALQHATVLGVATVLARRRAKRRSHTGN